MVVYRRDSVILTTLYEVLELDIPFFRANSLYLQVEFEIYISISLCVFRDIH